MSVPVPSFNNQPSPNQSPGRQGQPVRHITFHHVVGSAESAISKFKNPASQTSAHFVVGANQIYCCVDTDNTAWTNGNWASNLECVTIEHEGDWRFGFRDENVINNSVTLVAWLRTLYPSATPNRHRDVSTTQCCGDLPVEEIWNKATERLAPVVVPPPVVAPATPIQITDITNRIVVTNKAANLWDLNFTTWATAKSVKIIPAGTEVEVSAVAKHPLGGSYYMTEYSFSKGIKNGLNVLDCVENTVPTPPVVVPPVVVPPVVVPPKYPNWFVQFWTDVIDAIKGILNKG